MSSVNRRRSVPLSRLKKRPTDPRRHYHYMPDDTSAPGKTPGEVQRRFCCPAGKCYFSVTFFKVEISPLFGWSCQSVSHAVIVKNQPATSEISRPCFSIVGANVRTLISCESAYEKTSSSHGCDLRRSLRGYCRASSSQSRRLAGFKSFKDSDCWRSWPPCSGRTSREESRGQTKSKRRSKRRNSEGLRSGGVFHGTSSRER